MRTLVFLAILLSLNTGFGATVKITGDDGWNAKVSFENPVQVKTPVFFIVYNKSGLTNSEILIKISNEQLVPLEIPDGDYFYSLLDGDHKNILEEKFTLKTPFRVSIKKTYADSAVLELSTTGRKTIEISLYLTNQPIKYTTAVFSGTTNYSIQELLPSSLYRAEVGFNGYRKNISFFTQPRNAALNKPVFGTFNRLPESRFVDDSTPAIIRVNDGKWEWFSGMAASGEVNAQDQFVYVNLEHLTKVRSVRSVWHAFYYPEKYYFVYGTDGRKWKYVTRNKKDFRDMFAPDNSPVKVDGFSTNIEAYYIGVVINRGEKIFSRFPQKNYVELMELEVYE